MRKDGNLYTPLEEGGIFKDEIYTQMAKNNEQLAGKREVTDKQVDELNDEC